MSSDLQWLLIRQNSSFQVKGVPGGPIFSREPGNLRNLHSAKYSAISDKSIDIQDTPAGISITTRKSKAAPNLVRSAQNKTTIRGNSSTRRSYGIVARVAKRGYRADLRPAAIARVSALLSARKKKETIKAQPVREKKVRGSKKGKAPKGLD